MMRAPTHAKSATSSADPQEPDVERRADEPPTNASFIADQVELAASEQIVTPMTWQPNSTQSFSTGLGYYGDQSVWTLNPNAPAWYGNIQAYLPHNGVPFEAQFGRGYPPMVPWQPNSSQSFSAEVEYYGDQSVWTLNPNAPAWYGNIQAYPPLDRAPDEYYGAASGEIADDTRSMWLNENEFPDLEHRDLEHRDLEQAALAPFLGFDASRFDASPLARALLVSGDAQEDPTQDMTDDDVTFLAALHPSAYEAIGLLDTPTDPLPDFDDSTLSGYTLWDPQSIWTTPNSRFWHAFQAPQNSVALDSTPSDSHVAEDVSTTPTIAPEQTLSNTQPTRLSYAQAARQKTGPGNTEKPTEKPVVMKLEEAPSDLPPEDHQNPPDSNAETVIHEQSDSPILRTEHPRGDWTADHALWETTLTEHFGWAITIPENAFEHFREPLSILTHTRAQMLTFDRLALRQHFQTLREFRKTGWARKINPSSRHPLLLLYPGDIDNLSLNELMIILDSRRPQDLMDHSQLWPQLSPGQKKRISLWSKNQWQPDAK